MNAEFDFPNPFEDEPQELERTFATPKKSALIPNSWPPKLVFDLALGLDNPSEIAYRYDMTVDHLDHLFEFPKFRQDVANLTRELRENNTIFLNKAKVQAETYLEDMHFLMQSMDTSPRDKIEIFKTLTKLADLEPKPAPPVQPGMFPGVSPGGTTRMIVEWVGGPKDHSNLNDQSLVEMQN